MGLRRRLLQETILILEKLIIFAHIIEATHNVGIKSFCVRQMTILAIIEEILKYKVSSKKTSHKKIIIVQSL